MAARIRVEQTVLTGKDGNKLQIPRIINGLWQLAGGHDKDVDIVQAAGAMDSLVSAGLDCFDMADHYGDAELVVGQHNISSDGHITAFTKWCPDQTGGKSFEQAEAAINLAMKRMNTDRIQLLQYHAWDYSDNTYLYNLVHLRTMQERGKIELIGLTNFDAKHLELLIASGFCISSNQVSCSVLDRRVELGPMSQVCSKHGVGILAYGTLLGGFLSEKWLDQPEPTDINSLNWSLRKYLRFIRNAGGWDVFQGILHALARIATKHGVAVSAVATRYVLDIPVVSAVIVGTRLSGNSQDHARRNLDAFTLTLDAEDRELIAAAQQNLQWHLGDCGDEYRRPPFLTAAGDLSDHLRHSSELEKVHAAMSKGMRIEYSSGGKWEALAGYCRAVRTGNSVHVSGTTAPLTIPSIPVVGGSSAGLQTIAVMDVIEGALKALGASPADVVRARIIIPHFSDIEPVNESHAYFFSSRGIRPALTLIIADLVSKELLVEVEVYAEVDAGRGGTLRLGVS